MMSLLGKKATAMTGSMLSARMAARRPGGPRSGIFFHIEASPGRGDDSEHCAGMTDRRLIQPSGPGKRKWEWPHFRLQLLL
jgi:hypothetical protein